MDYYHDNKEHILEERKEFYINNKAQILEERSKYYKENYATNIDLQRKKKETCDFGMVVAHYSMKKHIKSVRHQTRLQKLALSKLTIPAPPVEI